jgi:hypothetical protein
MTSVTYGMRKSLCEVTFDMYQGALPSFLNVLDCSNNLLTRTRTDIYKCSKVYKNNKNAMETMFTPLQYKFLSFVNLQNYVFTK